MNPAAMVASAAAYSLFLQQALSADDRLEAWLNTRLNRPLQPQDWQDFATWQSLEEDELVLALRLIRRRVMAQLMVRDLAGLANLDEVVCGISDFADFAIVQAAAFAQAHYTKLWGEPMGATSGKRQYLTVIAMGKLGGRELNVSSDIDLIFTFPEQGQTTGGRDLTQFFSRVGQKIIALLDEPNAEGRVFRVDMRLRPDGEAGPLVISEAALEQYLMTQGREWERYAWIKARVVTPHEQGVIDLVRPFVYRKYLDFNAYGALRNLHYQIGEQLRKKGMSNNIKLGAGGIREIEFITQIFQLIRGGRQKNLQNCSTRATLHLLAQDNWLPTPVVEKLLAAYDFLRRLEHRLQYRADTQTQTLPDNEEAFLCLAQSMGYDSSDALRNALMQVRQSVNQVFISVMGTPESSNQTLTGNWVTSLKNDSGQAALIQLGYSTTDAQSIAKRLQHWHEGARYRQLTQTERHRFDRLLIPALNTAARYADAKTTLFRLLDFMENIVRRSAYLSLLYEHPEALSQLTQILSQSSWVHDYLMRHPMLLDELLSSRLMHKEEDWDQMQARLFQLLDDNDRDREAQMDALRHFQHSHIFRLSVQDLAGLWPIEALSDELSALADMIVRAALRAVCRDLGLENSPFAVIGYGKLGGKELGYTSDLDLVYLYRDDHGEIYTRLANRLTTWLTAASAAGILYDVDLRLRPNGDAGFMATSWQAFLRYQQQQAWTFEHQAISRARFIAGDEKLGADFEALRRQVLCSPRDAKKLRQEIVDMRNKIAQTHLRDDNDVKYAQGGMVDCEFMVQYLVLLYAKDHPDLCENFGNIALLGMAATHGLISRCAAENVQQAYRAFRRIQHNSRLRDAVFVADDGVRQHYAAVMDLWQKLFGGVD